MKAQQIVLLVLAGALVGAGLMKVVQRPAPVPVAKVAVKTPAVVPPVAEPAPAPVVEPAPPAVEPAPTQQTAVAPPKVAAPARTARKEPPTHAKLVRPQPPLNKPSPFSPPNETPVVAQAAPPVNTPPVSAPPAETPAPPPVSTAPAREEPVPAAPVPPSVPPSVTLNAGTLIPVRLVDGLSSERNAPGDAFVATLDHELVADGFVIAERGARVEGRVVTASRGTKTGGGATLAIELTRLHTSDGQEVAIRTDSFEKRMDPNRGQDVAKIGAGAAIGAVIGAIAGGGKGAAVGAGVGGGAGAGDVLLTRKQATLPSETRLSFRLNSAVTLTERRED